MSSPTAMTREESFARAPLRRTDLPTGGRRLARFLLGKLLVRQRPGDLRVGRIVETEAYLPGDPASHACNGPTPRNATMFLAPGHAYVYRAYGNHWMLNVSSEPAGIGGGVLIRAARPLLGLDAMRTARGDRIVDHALARGPGCLAAAFAVDRGLDGIDLTTAGEIFLAADGVASGRVARSVRIGISKAADRPWRYFIADEPAVSGPRWLNNVDLRRRSHGQRVYEE